MMLRTETGDSKAEVESRYVLACAINVSVEQFKRGLISLDELWSRFEAVRFLIIFSEGANDE